MTAGVSRAAMTITPQPALAPSPQPRPAPTERALIAQNAEKGGPFWMPIRGPDRTLIDSPAPPAVAYVFAEDRKGERATELFAEFNGILQVDGYTGYNGLLDPTRPGGPVTFAFCFAHSRRKFYDVHVATGSPIAGRGVCPLRGV